MPTLLGGVGGAAVNVEGGTLALKVTSRPVDSTAAGSFASVLSNIATGPVGAGIASASPIVSFRWSSSTLAALIRRVEFAFLSNTTGFTAGSAAFNMFVARSFSASDTGGTSNVPASNNQKVRTSLSTSAVGDLRCSSTGTLTAGTRTLDANPIASVICGVTTAISTVFVPTTTLWVPNDAHWPLVLVQNEGFVIQATVPATGTWNFTAKIYWDELTLANYP